MILGHKPTSFNRYRYAARPYDVQMQFRTTTPSRKILVKSINIYCAGWGGSAKVAAAVWNSSTGAVLINGGFKTLGQGNSSSGGQSWYKYDVSAILAENTPIGIGWARGQASNYTTVWSGVTGSTSYWQNSSTYDDNFPRTFSSGGTYSDAIGAYIEYYYPLESISISNKTLNVGATASAAPSLSPSDASYTLIYQSSNTNVFTVNSSGTITAVGAGTATLTVKDTYGSEKSTTATITVRVPVTEVSVSPTTATKDEGQTLTVTATVSPSNATNKDVTWSSSNTSVATVSSTGVVNCLSKGTAVITAKTVDGAKTVTCTVTVIRRVMGVTVFPQSFNMDVGHTRQLTATVSPYTANNTAVSWSSSNTAVATVSSSGMVSAVGYGNTTITVTTSDGGKKATAAVAVNDRAVWYPLFPFVEQDSLEYYHIEQFDSDLRYLRQTLIDIGYTVGSFQSINTTAGYSIGLDEVLGIINAVESNLDTIQTAITWENPYYIAPKVWSVSTPKAEDINRWVQCISYYRKKLKEITGGYLFDKDNYTVVDSTGAKIIIANDDFVSQYTGSEINTFVGGMK